MKRNYIIDTIIDNDLIVPASAVIVGVSGGPDSLCLLHALNSIADMYDLLLVPVHINHMLRPEAYDESMHLSDICDRMDLELRIYEASCKDVADELGISVEEAGRQVRYQIFDEVAAELEENGVPRMTRPRRCSSGSYAEPVLTALQAFLRQGCRKRDISSCVLSSM